MMWAVAASVLLLIAAGALFWRQPATITASAGEHVVATLPDGSTVELNSGTTLSYPRRFSTWLLVPADHRVVRLQGEAFFDVKPAARPFIVETFNARIEVLGTQFNVRARADHDTGETQVTLAKGRVRIQAAERPADAVTLAEAGQTSRVQASSTPTPSRAVGIDRALAWRQQGFAVSDWPLPAILAELERRYDLRITVRGTVVHGDSMTLYYPRHTEAETIIHDIAVAKGLAYRATSRGFEITAQ
jgi:ferric-dicitrate binding protein FerR (iron transport regulator)